MRQLASEGQITSDVVKGIARQGAQLRHQIGGVLVVPPGPLGGLEDILL